jgi:hypothetical protein
MQNDNGYDDTSEEGKLLACVQDESVTYASTRDLEPPRATSSIYASSTFVVQTDPRLMSPMAPVTVQVHSEHVSFENGKLFSNFLFSFISKSPSDFSSKLIFQLFISRHLRPDSCVERTQGCRPTRRSHQSPTPTRLKAQPRHQSARLSRSHRAASTRAKRTKTKSSFDREPPAPCRKRLKHRQ